VQVGFVDESGAKQSGALEVLWGAGFEHVLPVRSFGSFRGQRMNVLGSLRTAILKSRLPRT
jgi:hypothetical protein